MFCTERLDREAFRQQDQRPTYRKELHESERGMLEPLLADGFELVGCGIARIVLRFPDSSAASEYVVKLSRFGISTVSHGVVQNHREVLLWNRHGESGEWPLAPVVAYERERFAWLVMPYGEAISDRPEDERDEHLWTVRSQIRFLQPFDMRELLETNIVLIDGEPRIVDYGDLLRDALTVVSNPNV
ncbi:MAG: hypothetical protein ABEH58_08480 [Haloplanus sp.]